MSSMGKLLTVETKLFLREPPARLLGAGVPALLLAALGGLFPGFTEPVKEFGGLRLIDVYLPISLVVALATVGVTRLPVLASYRQYGILRQFAVTPVGPSRLLSTQLLVHLGAAIVATVLAVGVAVIAFDVPFQGPGDVRPGAAPRGGGHVLDRSPDRGAGTHRVVGPGIAMAVYFPMLLFAGVYFLRDDAGRAQGRERPVTRRGRGAGDEGCVVRGDARRG